MKNNKNKTLKVIRLPIKTHSKGRLEPILSLNFI